MTINYTELDGDKLEFVPVAEENEILSGQRLFVQIDDHDIVIFNIAKRLFAIANVCSHDDGPLGDGSIESEFDVACPRHGARFDVRSGKAKSLPAIINIPAYPVRVQGGNVEVGIPVT